MEQNSHHALLVSFCGRRRRNNIFSFFAFSCFTSLGRAAEIGKLEKLIAAAKMCNKQTKQAKRIKRADFLHLTPSFFGSVSLSINFFVGRSNKKLKRRKQKTFS